jgi:hypothetical protein
MQLDVIERRAFVEMVAEAVEQQRQSIESARRRGTR